MLKNLQEELKPWVKHNFGDRPSWQPLLGIVEELGELAHAHLKHAQEIRTDEQHFENKKDAIADIIIYLADYCTAEGIDLESTVQEVWDKVKKRDWKKNPKNAHQIADMESITLAKSITENNVPDNWDKIYKFFTNSYNYEKHSFDPIEKVLKLTLDTGKKFVYSYGDTIFKYKGDIISTEEYQKIIS